MKKKIFTDVLKAWCCVVVSAFWVVENLNIQKCGWTQLRIQGAEGGMCSHFTVLGSNELHLTKLR